jgi:hypothetical protein
MRTGPACIERRRGDHGHRDSMSLMPMLRTGCTALALFLTSCGAEVPLQRGTIDGHMEESPVRFSIVCVIHGDGNYLYHDTSGRESLADEEALSGMKSIAERNPYADVFIFHQKQGRTAWLFFPLRDGEFYCYRGGRLVAHEAYWRDQERSHLVPETELYQRFHAGRGSGATALFLYFGHEIPEFGGAGYDASYPDRPFTVRDLAEGLQGFTAGAGRFDLMILSTCYGGTPYTIGALGTSARTIVASPDNLHLSYFALHMLERLDTTLTRGDVPALADRFARQAFDRLTAEVQTAVSVAVYDVDRAQAYVTAVGGTYDAALTTAKSTMNASVVTMEHCDCADVPGYTLPAMNQGVNLLYRPPAFGRSRQKEHHSGWECWREVQPQGSGSQIQETVSK